MTKMLEFPSAQALADHTAATVHALLKQGVAETGRAAFVIPGGRTPAAFLTALGALDLDWSLVAVTLSDERWVPIQAPESNEALVRRTLMAGKAERAQFISLYNGAASPQAGIAVAEERLKSAAQTRDAPWDAVVLGMGDDGHFASLFPGEANLAAGLDLANPALCQPALGPSGGPPRLSLTLSCLARAKAIFVLATGEAKKALWQSPGALPIAALQKLAAPEVQFLWCP